ncbi:MAG: polymerase subunit gamma/tau, partial [Chloroflexota bacterium]|nr:polymerase subunit gamma/tau [Chloroflexota bacterium]
MVGTGVSRSTEGARHSQSCRSRSEGVLTSPVPHQALYRRWRAQTFAEIVGQEAVVETLRNAVRADRVGHAILFVGPRGTGKTSLARILAKAVNCTDLRDGDACDVCPSCVSIREGTTLDLIEIDAASNRGIDDVRNLRERLPYPPGQLRKKVYILDEAHQITRDAWNALLKSLEEPPPFVVFMFASTEPSLFPPAILSRLQRFDVRRLTIPEIEGKLSRILAADGRQAEPGAIHLIARLAAGGMRDAESMLDQLLSAAPDRIDESHVRDLLGLADADAVESFVDVLVRGDVAAGVGLLDQLDERGRDIRALLDQVVDAIRDEIVAGVRDESGAR